MLLIMVVTRMRKRTKPCLQEVDRVIKTVELLQGCESPNRPARLLRRKRVDRKNLLRIFAIVLRCNRRPWKRRSVLMLAPLTIEQCFGIYTRQKHLRASSMETAAEWLLSSTSRRCCHPASCAPACARQTRHPLLPASPQSAGSMTTIHRPRLRT